MRSPYNMCLSKMADGVQIGVADDRTIYPYPGKAKSKVLDFFGFYKSKDGPPNKTTLDMSVAICKVCKKKYSNKGNTTNFMHHIDTVHGPINKQETSNAPKQASMTAFVNVNQAGRISPDRQEKIDDALCKFIAGKAIPASTVDNQLFKDFVGLLDPRYKVPSRKTVMRRLQNKKTEVDVKLKKEISLSENISITHDGWTSLNTESYFTTTVHFINESWELKNAVLGTIKVTGSHTSEAIADELKATQTKWGLPTPLATTDNAANEKKAYEILGWDRFGCYGHRINLMVKNSLNIPEVNRLLGKARKLVTFFHQSSSIFDLLCEKQKLLFDDSRANLVGHKLIIDVATRWNSSLYMLQRLSEQFPVLMALANDPSLSKQASTTLKNCVFSFEEQSIIENIVAILEPFEKATTIVCADQVPTVHKILPIITKLLKIVEVSDDDRSVIKKIKDKLQCEINRRTLTDKITLLACILNPFTKDLNFAPEMRDQARAYLIEESGDFRQVPTLKIKTEKQDDELSGQEVSEASQVGEIPALPTLTMDPATDREMDSKNEVASDEGPPTKKMKSVDTDDWLEDIVCTGESKANPSTAIELEIDRYLESKIIEKDLNLTLLQWWKMYEHFYPRINRIAKNIFVCLLLQCHQNVCLACVVKL